MSFKTFEPGDSVKLTWVDSGITLDSSSYQIFDGDEAMIGSAGSLTSSGNGHYYALYTIPSSLNGFYVARISVAVGGTPYRRSQRFRVIPVEVD